VENGEADALVSERVWQELARGLMEKRPSRMFEMLRECGALARVAPEIDALWDDPETSAAAMGALDGVAQAGATLPARFATLTRFLEPLAVESVATRLKVPSDCRDLALLAARHANTIADAAELDATALLELFNAVDLWRRPERLAELAAAALAGEEDAPAARASLERARDAVLAVNAGAIAKTARNPGEIQQRIANERLTAIARALGKRRS
jgi:tRNA nucleotidyltransferase (CCA-adding enzyme)